MRQRLEYKEIFVGQLVQRLALPPLPFKYKAALVALQTTWFAYPADDDFYITDNPIVADLRKHYANDVKIQVAVLMPRPHTCPNIKYIPYHKLLQSFLEWRSDYNGDMADLVESIRVHDVLNALTVRRAGQEYVVLQGFRRVRACMTLALRYREQQPWWEYIPCQVVRSPKPLVYMSLSSTPPAFV